MNFELFGEVIISPQCPNSSIGLLVHQAPLQHPNAAEGELW